jgi:hypothetical protein
MKFVMVATTLATLLLSAPSSRAFPVDSNNIYLGPLVQAQGNGAEQTLYPSCGYADEMLAVNCWTDDSTASLLSDFGACTWNNRGSRRGYRRANAVCVHR